MKLLTLIISFAFLFPAQQGYSQPADTLKAEYELVPSRGFTMLLLTYNILDTAGHKPENEFLSDTKVISYSTVTPSFNLSLAQTALIAQIRKSKNLDLYVYRPSYINQIIGMIPSAENRAKAIRIYNEENIGSAILSSIREMKSSFRNQTKNQILLTIEIPLIIKADTKLVLEPYPLEYKKQQYVSGKIEITLKKQLN